MSYQFVCFLGVLISFWGLPSEGKFPDAFRWCSATAAHQVEGNNIHSDWWAFEKVHGHIKNNEQSGRAVDHWNLYKQDIDGMKAIGLNTYRFSVEWAKIQPTSDRFDPEAIKHYKKMVLALKAAGIEPMITLHHFTLPNWLAQKGGWSNPESIEAFVKYSTYVFEELKKDVATWVTFNEPMVVVTAGYIDGVFPPQKKGDAEGALKALKHILTSHGQAVKKLRSLDQSHRAQFGFAHHLRVFQPYSRFNPLDRILAGQLDQIWNWAFTDALVTGHFELSLPFQASIDTQIPELVGSQDFFGLNYYSRDLVQFTLSAPYFRRLSNPESLVSDLGWEIYPEGLGELLRQIHKKYSSLPILITENGIADGKDSRRGDFIKAHLQQVESAIDEHIPVMGYCHWSLMDNFEWAEGFTPRFGLFEVDYKNLKRKQRPSSKILEQIIKDKSTLVVNDGNKKK